MSFVKGWRKIFTKISRREQDSNLPTKLVLPEQLNLIYTINYHRFHPAAKPLSYLSLKNISFTKLTIKSQPKRFEPSSRTFLISEQLNPSQLLHQEDKVSRHRGAELRRRYELLGGTSLLSLE